MCAQDDDTQDEGPRYARIDNLYDYVDPSAPRARPSRRTPSPRIFHVGKVAVTDDWPDSVPVTEAEVDIFERYFGDVLDRLFAARSTPPANRDLPSLTPDDNNIP